MNLFLRPTRAWIRRLVWISISVAALGWIGAVSIAIHEYGRRDWVRYSSISKLRPVDAIVVLGAAVDYDRPSPVVEARLRHAVDLYDEGVAPKLIFTGGLDRGDLLAESEAGRDYAKSRGVPATAILLETESRTTLGNLRETRRLLDSVNSGKRIVIVSDSHHLLRASWMAHRLDLNPSSSRTPYTCYHTLRTKIPAVLREVYFLHHYALFRC